MLDFPYIVSLFYLAQVWQPSIAIRAGPTPVHPFWPGRLTCFGCISTQALDTVALPAISDSDRFESDAVALAENFSVEKPLVYVISLDVFSPLTWKSSFRDVMVSCGFCQLGTYSAGLMCGEPLRYSPMQLGAVLMRVARYSLHLEWENM